MKLSALILFLISIRKVLGNFSLLQRIDQIISILDDLPADDTVNSLFINSNKTLASSLMASEPESSSAELRQLHELLSSYLEAFEPMMKSAERSSLSRFVSFLGFAAVVGSNDNDESNLVAEPEALLVRLERCGTDRASFSTLISEIERSKSDISLEEFNALSRQYTGISRKAKSKKEAIERIERHFEVGAQNASRIAAISKIS